MIYLLRHGQIDTGGEKRYIGWSSFPLDDHGVRQANQWREKLSGIHFDAIYSSDLTRASQTAEIIAQGRPVKKSPALREINMGNLENKSMATFRKQFPDQWRERGKNLFFFRPPGGESFSDVCDRAVPEFEKIAGEITGTSLVVSHAGVNRMILCHILGMPPDNMFRIGQDYACLNIIDHSKIPYRVMALNMSVPVEG